MVYSFHASSASSLQRDINMFGWVRPTLQTILAIGFFIFFGLPQLQRFLEKNVMVITTKRNTGGIEAPAVTIVISKHDDSLGSGWKNISNLATLNDIIQHQCDNENISDCITHNTYSLKGVIQDALIGFTNHQFIMDPSFWIEDFTTTVNGRSYTLNISRKIGLDDSIDQLFFIMKYDFKYEIYIHDKKYFVLNSNPFGPPTIYRRFIANSTLNYYYRLAMIEHRKLNLQTSPCEEDSDYNFNACIKKSLSRMFGCRLPWDQWTDPTTKECSSVNQFR